MPPKLRPQLVNSDYSTGVWTTCGMQGVLTLIADDRPGGLYSEGNVDEPLLTRSPSPSETSAWEIRHGETPDARQLHQSLREASASVAGSPTKKQVLIRTEFPSAVPEDSNTSTPTPTPPIEHTISSSTSSPTAPVMNSVLTSEESSPVDEPDLTYPLLEAQEAQEAENDEESIDDESTISWELERQLHDDDVQRVRPELYRRTPRGKNISAPPRRLSGLTFGNDTVHDISNVDSPLKKSPIRLAPTRTVISTAVTGEDEGSAVASEGDSGAYSTQSFDGFDRARRQVTFVTAEKRLQINWFLIVAVLAALSAIGAYILDWKLPSLPPLSRPGFNYPQNASDGALFKQLYNEVDKLGRQMSTISWDVYRLQHERNNVERVTTVQPAPPPEVTHKVNFLTLGAGTTIDRTLTSPSIGRKPTLFRRLLFGDTRRQQQQLPRPNPPETALTAWDGEGDCWCSAPGNAGQAQLAIVLGQRGVPDEIVVEHIPARSSTNPGVAPREMELWAQFKLQPHSPQKPMSQTKEATQKMSWFRSSSFSNAGIGTHDTSPSSLLKTIMTTLQNAYPNEPHTAYSNDPLLGPSFFRIGKWEYDGRLTSADDDDPEPPARQSFPLNAVVDHPALRVDKVVIRVRSNWGGNYTCLYRVRLLGHV